MSEEIVSVSCEDWSCGNAPDFCHGGCPNWDPHSLPLSEIPEEYQDFFSEFTSREVS